MLESEKRLRDLLIRGLAGDAPAYHVCLKELSAHLRAFLRRKLFGLPDDVEDLVQEILLAIHNQRHTYDADQPLTAWVHAIARYKVIDLLRRRDHLRSVWIWHGPLLLAGILSAVILTVRTVPGRLRDALPVFLLLAGWALFSIKRRLRQAADLQQEIGEIRKE